MIHHGSCHCGAVKFTVEAPAEITVSKCNCSICSQTGFLHLIVKAGEFTLLQGEDNLTLYSFNSHTARHLFCKTCGVKSFYVPRSHPNGYSVNVNCLNRKGFTKIIIEGFDGQNWEDNINQLI